MNKNNDALSSSKISLILSTLKMAIATLASRVLGLVREQVMAAYFGASGITDAFTVAYRVPNLLRDLFAEGAFSSAFVPIFTEKRLKDPELARRLLWRLFVILFTLTTIIGVVIVIWAPLIVDAITNDQFTKDAGRLEITITLVRIMAPFLCLISIAALFMGALNSIKIFFIPSLAPAFFNIIMIASMIFLPEHIEKLGFHPIFSLGVGVVFGGFVQMMIQVPLIIKNNYGPISPKEMFCDGTQRIINRLGLGTIGIAATQINIFVTTIIATGTQLGAVSWLNYAFRLFQFPVGILSVSIAGSNLVHFSDSWKIGDKEKAIEILRTSLFFSILTIVPAFSLLMALRIEVVQIIFERGLFNSEDSMNTAIALKYYLFGLPFYGFYKILAPTFFTLDRAKTPIIISVCSIAINLIFCLALAPHYGFSILALGTSLSMFLNSLTQYVFVTRYLGISVFGLVSFRFLKIIFSGLVCYLLTHWAIGYNFVLANDFLDKVINFTLSSVIGGLSYFLLLGLMGEASVVKKWLKFK